MLGRVEILAFFAELLDAELFERLVDFGGNGFEGFVHFAVFANAIDVIKCRQQCGQHVDDAVLAEAFLLLLRTIAEVDEFRTFALKGFQVFRRFLLGLAKRSQRIFTILRRTIRSIAVFLRFGRCCVRCSCCRICRIGSCTCCRIAIILRFLRCTGCRGGLPGQVVHVGQIVQIFVLVEVGHDYLLSLSSSSTTSASTTSSSAGAEPAAPAAPAASAAPCCA